jgi:hypothetical protein
MRGLAVHALAFVVGFALATLLGPAINVWILGRAPRRSPYEPDPWDEPGGGW